jgi:hypothetical protein
MRLNPIVVSQRTEFRFSIMSLSAHYRELTLTAHSRHWREEDKQVFDLFRRVDVAAKGADEQAAWKLLQMVYPNWQHKPMKDEYLHNLLVQRSELCLSFSDFHSFVTHQESVRMDIKELQVQSMEIALRCFGLTRTSKKEQIYPRILFAEPTGAYTGFMCPWKERWSFSNQCSVRLGAMKGMLTIELSPSLFEENAWGVNARVNSHSLGLQHSIEKTIPTYYAELERELGISVISLTRKTR